MDTSYGPIAVYGATGYTGRLVLAELALRRVDLVLVGRNAERLREVGVPGTETRVAALDDPAALVAAFAGCAVVVSCVAPFVSYGEPVVRAAIAAGCQYLDISGEVRHVERVFATFAVDAERAGVTVVPMVNDGGCLADLVTDLAARGLEPVDTIRLSHRLTGTGGLSRGSARTALLNLDQLRTAAALPEVATVHRHVPARRIEGPIEPDLLARLTPEVLRQVASQPTDGPREQERQQARFTLTADVLAADGRRARGVVAGVDTYGTTAVTVAEATRRLAADATKPGVLAPAQAFDAEQFLCALRPYGVTWRVER